MGVNARAVRRHYSAELKAQVLSECASPGASVAKVGMAHGINANIVHRWRSALRQADAHTASPTPATRADLRAAPLQFLPVAMVTGAPQDSVAPSSRSIEVELQRGTTTLKLKWPATASAQLIAWTREVLR